MSVRDSSGSLHLVQFLKPEQHHSQPYSEIFISSDVMIHCSLTMKEMFQQYNQLQW